MLKGSLVLIWELGMNLVPILHYKFYIYVNARLPFKADSKKIESGYSKFSMLLPNFQSPRLRRLVCK